MIRPSETAAAHASAQARAAWEQGHAALREDRVEDARRWFARACRLAPGDATPRSSLATASLLLGRPEAATLFREVALATDVRLAWLGLAVALMNGGAFAEAAVALHRALSRHAGALADEDWPGVVAARAGYAGWCGLDSDGRLIGRVDAAGQPGGRVDGPVRVTFDGRWQPGLGFGGIVPAGVARVRVTRRGRPLLGSPLRLDIARRLQGVVDVDAAGDLVGWAWHPGNPAHPPEVTLIAGPLSRTVRATDRTVAAPRPLAEPRGFRVPAAELAEFVGPIHVRGPDGAPLTGSPVYRTTRAPAAAARAGGRAPARPRRTLAIVVPAYRGAGETAACLRDVLGTAPPGTAVIVVDDASPEPALTAMLRGLAADGRIRLLRHAVNTGFPAAANTGLRAALALRPARDIVLLNSDTRMVAGWAERLRAAVHIGSGIGTATPLSNDASLASYPEPDGNPPPGRRELARLSRLAAAANPTEVIDVPTGVGFCLYLRHECLTQTGLFREDVFAAGYGEENDFCQRAASLGWRHVVVPGAYVAHVGGRSFGAVRPDLLDRNLAVLERLHPGYGAQVAAWRSADPLGPARRRLDRLRWLARPRSRPAVLLVTHDQGGGVERCVQARADRLRADARRPILLRSVPGRAGACRIVEAGADIPSLVFEVPAELAELAAVLRACRPVALEVHHLLGHDHAILDLARRLALPYDLRLHDYAAFCPRVTLTGAADRYCGEPAVAGCIACVAAHGNLLPDGIGPVALRARSAAELAGARRRIVPSADMAARLRRHWPGLAFDVEPHERDVSAPPHAGLRQRGMPSRGAARALVVGAIGRAKGYDVLLACARDAADRGLDLRFLVVGRTIDDEALLDTGRVEITGPYREGEALDLIAEQAATIGFLPSLWPETWCFALGEMLRAGLPVVAFDIGGQAERVRHTGQGWLLPLGAPAATVNIVLTTPPPLRSPLPGTMSGVLQTASDRGTSVHQPHLESSR